jgi:hypothetical protein
VHLGGGGAGKRSLLAIQRPYSSVWVEFRQVFDDRGGLGNEQIVGDFCRRFSFQPGPLSGASSSSKGISKWVSTSQGRTDQLE